MSKSSTVANPPSGRTFRGVAAEQRKAERRTRVIAAALRLYAERGYHNVSVKAVCIEAGLTERYFYESFANGEEALIACYDLVIRFIIAQAEAGAAAEPTNPARGFLTAYCRTLKERPAEAGLFLVEFSSVSKATAKAFSLSLDSFATSIAATLGGDPEVARPDPMLMRGIIGGIHQMALFWVADQPDRPIDAVVSLALAMLRGSLGAVATETEQ